MSLDETKNAEETHTVNDIDLMIDNTVLPLTGGNELDFITNAHGQGLAISRTDGVNC